MDPPIILLIYSFPIIFIFVSTVNLTQAFMPCIQICISFTLLVVVSSLDYFYAVFTAPMFSIWASYILTMDIISNLMLQ